MFFFGPPRILLFFLLLFFLFQVFFYSPGFFLIVAGVGLVATLALGRRRSPPLEEAPEPRALPERPFEEVRRAAQDDLLALADDIRALDIDMELPGASQQAKQDYERALGYYEQAARAFDAAKAPGDFEAVSHAVEEGRFAITSAKARLDGRQPPPRRPPCFFDPRHGPSVRDVEWAPPFGTPRRVPACAADAIRIEEGEEPAARQVLAHGRRVPYWDAPAYYGPWAGGFFGGGGGILPALLVGSALAAGFSVFDPFDGGSEGADPFEYAALESGDGELEGF